MDSSARSFLISDDILPESNHFLSRPVPDHSEEYSQYPAHSLEAHAYTAISFLSQLCIVLIWFVLCSCFHLTIFWYLEYHFFHRASEICVAGKYPQFLSACCLATPEFFAILASAVDGFYRSNKRTAWFCVGILLPVA